MTVCVHLCVCDRVSAGDASSFIQENRALKLQLERLVAERDDLRSKVSRGAGLTAQGAGLWSLNEVNVQGCSGVVGCIRASSALPRSAVSNH